MKKFSSKVTMAIMLVFAVGVFWGCGIIGLKNQHAEIKIGECYQYSLYWNNPNPFDDKKIDTVKVVAIIDNYVQWQYKDGSKTSDELQYFKHFTRPLN